MSLITIGVPTYNRKDIVYKTLMHLINSDLSAEDVEFLVSDNASEDGTFELLSTIEDDRLSLYQNESNLGAVDNIYIVINKSKSNSLFSILMSDEDYIDIDELKKFISEIKNNLEYYKENIGGFVFNKNMDKKLCRGEDIGDIFKCGYMSGLVFNRNLLNRIDYITNGTVYAHIHTFVRLYDISDIIFYNKDIYIAGKENGDNYAPDYVFPANRLEQCKLDFRELNNVTRFHKNELFSSGLNTYIAKFNSLFVYDLLYRNEFHKNYFKLEKDEFVIEKYMNKFNTFLLDYVEEFYSDKIEETREFINKTNFELYKTLNARYKFELAKLKGYEIVMLRSEVDLLEERGWNLLGMMQHYKYIVDKIVDDTSEITDDQIFLKYNYDIRDHENCKDINWSRLVRGMRKEHTYVQYPKISL